MARLLTLEFWRHCHLGEIARTFVRRGASVESRRLDEAGELPRGHRGWDGLVMMGGPQHAEDDDAHPFLGRSAALARRFHDAGKPVLGVCLGGQVLARGLGARVRRQGWTELGFTASTPTPAAARDTLLAGVAATHLFQYHEDSFDLPPGARLLMTGGRCRNQAFRLGASYGFQGHFEASTTLWREWLDHDLRRSLSRLDPGYLARWPEDFAAHEGDSLAFCETVSGRWLDLVEARAAAAA